MIPRRLKSGFQYRFEKWRLFIFSAIEYRFGKFITFHFRPITSKVYGLKSKSSSSLPAYAVILQGPVVTDYKFSLETARLYKKLFPDGRLIVSTWDDTPKHILEELRADGVELVVSLKPEKAGNGNINYQLVSTQAGLRRARELGAAYVLKTRTDQRMYATNVYQFLLGLLSSFPLHTNTSQQKRLVALGFNTIQYRPYSLCDMLFFGTIDDMDLYWSIPLDVETKQRKDRTVKGWVTQKVAEGYLMSSFLRNIGHAPKDTLADFWNALGNFFILIDAEMLDLYWLKYNRFKEHRERRYDALFLSSDVGFREWIILYQSLYDKQKVPEHIWPSLINLTTSTKITF